MGVKTEKYIRKPLYVDAVRVTEENFDEIVEWCQGEVLTEEHPEWNAAKKYIKVRIHQPKFPRQTKAFVGDWLLYTERGYKVYTNRAFRASFDEVQNADSIPNGNEDGVEATLERAPIVPETLAEAVEQETGHLAAQIETPVVSDSDSAPPPQTEDGRRILTTEEQIEMGSDEVTNLLRTGEVVLAQDLV